MFGLDSGVNSSPNNDSNTNYSTSDYLRLAKAASSNGDQLLSAYLYIAAFEKDCSSSSGPQQTSIAGLRKAWKIACENKQGPLAEHIYELLEPYSSEDEIKQFAQRMQDLALDKLEDIGFTRDDVEKMTEAMSSNLMNSGVLPHLGFGQFPDPNSQNQGQDSHAASGLYQPGLLIPPATPFGKVTEYRSSGGNGESKPNAKKDKAEQHQKKATSAPDTIEMFGYDELVGYDSAIEKMREYGIGISGDERFKNFLEMLSRHHGISSLPAVQTMVFRADAREDATHFMAATVGELSQPTVRMYMEESPQGIPVLCVMASNDFKSRFQFIRSGFDIPTVLMLEDVDLWGAPLMGFEDDFNMSQLGRGAREVILMIRSAVENPNVTVVASVGSNQYFEPFLREMLDPVEYIDIELPTRDERAAVWKHSCTLYPSLRYVDLDDLVRLSHGLSRYDIYMAAREAVEQAYKESMHRHAYVPVMAENVFDKIAAYQPLDSKEYAEIEESTLENFRLELENIDDILKEDWE